MAHFHRLPNDDPNRTSAWILNSIQRHLDREQTRRNREAQSNILKAPPPKPKADPPAAPADAGGRLKGKGKGKGGKEKDGKDKPKPPPPAKVLDGSGSKVKGEDAKAKAKAEAKAKAQPGDSAVTRYCFFFQHDKCTRGNDCQYLHTKLSDADMKKLKPPRRQSASPARGGGAGGASK